MKRRLVEIVAVLASGSLGCAGSVTPCHHAAQPVTAASGRPLAVRAEMGVLWASAGVWAEPHRIWTMPARGAVDDLVVGPMPGGYFVTFRQGGVLWRGELDASRAGRGGLQPIAARDDVTPVAAQRSSALCTAR
jgi:hypothetical protein